MALLLLQFFFHLGVKLKTAGEKIQKLTSRCTKSQFVFFEQGDKKVFTPRDTGAVFYSSFVFFLKHESWLWRRALVAVNTHTHTQRTGDVWRAALQRVHREFSLRWNTQTCDRLRERRGPATGCHLHTLENLMGKRETEKHEGLKKKKHTILTPQGINLQKILHNGSTFSECCALIMSVYHGKREQTLLSSLRVN